MKSIVLFFIGSVVFSLQGWAQADVQKKLQKQLILAEAGAVIELLEGVFVLGVVVGKVVVEIGVAVEETRVIALV